MTEIHENKVFEVFRKCLKLAEDVDRSTLIYNETQNWDSIGHMSLVANLEEEFDCMMDTDDILDLSDFNKATTIMEKYL